MTSKKILIVEDDPKSLYAFKSVLQDRGFQVVAFQSAEEALPQIKDSYDAALLDVRLPRMQGPDFAILLQKEQPRLHLVFVTAYNGIQELRSRFPNSNVFVKPIDLQQLLSAL